MSFVFKYNRKITIFHATPQRKPQLLCTGHDLHPRHGGKHAETGTTKPHAPHSRNTQPKACYDTDNMAHWRYRTDNVYANIDVI